MSIKKKIEVLRSAGFTVGERNPQVNRAFAGRFMVIEDHEGGELPTDDGRNGPWAIVGDNLNALVQQAYDAFEGDRF